MTTRGSMVVLGIAAVALLAHASTASGAGKITGIALNPPEIETCGFETITIKGTGTCGPYTVFWGDSDKIIFLASKAHPGTFPVQYTHQYSKAGTYTVSVRPYSATCTGKPSVKLQVSGPAPTPIITTVASFVVFPPTPEATPGSLVILKGENFGNLPGQVWIHLKDWQGNPHDYQLLYTDTHWGDTFVAGVIPPISGVLDQQATFTLVPQCGAVSDAWPVQFTAAPDYADLADHVDRLECSISRGASVSDQCMGWGGSNWPTECGEWPGGGGLDYGNLGLGGYHASGWGFRGNGGNDRFWVTTALQNGWALYSASATWQTKVGDVSTASEDPNTTSAQGSPSPSLGVDWYVGNCGMVLYYGHMIITGPVGVPF